jgi:hypothetical protein
VRIALTGPPAGPPEPFVSNLPGLPDNMSSAPDGSYWVAFPSPRLPLVDRLMPHPAPRRIAARLPERLQPAAQRYGLVARIGAGGAILQTLHGPAAPTARSSASASTTAGSTSAAWPRPPSAASG